MTLKYVIHKQEKLPAPGGASSLFGQLCREDYRGSLQFNNWALQCCGLGTIQGIAGAYYGTTYEEEAEFVAGLYRALYNPANVLYSIVQHKGGYAQAVLLKLGAVKIHEYHNQYHGPAKIELWMVNVLNAVGRYCNEYGEAYTEPPAVLPANFIKDGPCKRGGDVGHYPELPKREPT